MGFSIYSFFFFKVPGIRINFAPVISSPEFLLCIKVLTPNLTSQSFFDDRVLSINMLYKGGICNDSDDSSNEMKGHRVRKIFHMFPFAVLTRHPVLSYLSRIFLCKLLVLYLFRLKISSRSFICPRSGQQLECKQH